MSDPKSMTEQRRSQALIELLADFMAACGGDLHPAEAETCGPLAWLSTAIGTLEEVRSATLSEEGADPDAYFQMVAEVRDLHEKLTAACLKALSIKDVGL